MNIRFENLDDEVATNDGYGDWQNKGDGLQSGVTTNT